MLPAEITLSKARFTAGLQCHKHLWWRVHDADAPELTPSNTVRHRFDLGSDVARVARAYVPGGTLVDLPRHERARRVAATREALAAGAPAVYEAAFSAGSLFGEVDILERLDGADEFRVIEVKEATRRKQAHIVDVALQVHVLRQAGLTVPRADVMHLNPACRYPDLTNLFVRQDVTPLVEAYLLELPGEAERQLAMLRGPRPDVAIGEQCTRPYPCPFFDRCWPTPPRHHVGTLYTMPRREALALEARGYQTLYQLPTDLELSVIRERQVRAVTSGTTVVEPSLREALLTLASPVAYLDFETVGLPIPRWTGCRPWEAVPVQFSLHVQAAGGRYTHHAWLADGPDDPRRELAHRLVAAADGARSVVAYYAKFERQCLRHLTDHVPELAVQLEDITSKLVDLGPLVRNHVYHPDFGGSFSIKHVLPALVPELSYRDLAIQDGEAATVQLRRLLLRGKELAAGEAEQLRDALLRYCERDSWAMVRLHERLRGLAGTDQLELGV